MEEGVKGVEEKKGGKERPKLVQRTEGVCGHEHCAACIRIKRQSGVLEHWKANDVDRACVDL
jgi:hypothetical protein